MLPSVRVPVFVRVGIVFTTWLVVGLLMPTIVQAQTQSGVDAGPVLVSEPFLHGTKTSILNNANRPIYVWFYQAFDCVNVNPIFCASASAHAENRPPGLYVIRPGEQREACVLGIPQDDSQPLSYKCRFGWGFLPTLNEGMSGVAALIPTSGMSDWGEWTPSPTDPRFDLRTRRGRTHWDYQIRNPSATTKLDYRYRVGCSQERETVHEGHIRRVNQVDQGGIDCPAEVQLIYLDAFAPKANN